MSPPCPRGTESRMSFPRVSGDEPGPMVPDAGDRMFSPRERG